MKKIFLLFIFLIFSAMAFAHPMGNFSINHYSGLTADASGLRIDYIIDMAEIPTFQEMSSLDANQNKQVSDFEARSYAAKKAQEFQRRLSLIVNGDAVRIEIQKSALKIVPGAAGLPTIVMRFSYLGQWKQLHDQNSLEYRDENFPDRLGWKEIVLHKSAGLSIYSNSVSFTDRSSQLTQYPADPTLSPPQETKAVFELSPKPGFAKWNQEEMKDAFLASASRRSRDDRFTKLISTAILTGRVLILSLLIAFVLGAMHAMSPGHGKTIVAGYLVGSRGTALHAVFLGAVVTLTHTIGVFFLGLITLYGSRYILPEHLYPWLGFASGMSIVVIGIMMFRKRLPAIRHHRSSHTNKEHEHAHSHHHDHNHSHDHHHQHSHDHSHLPVDSTTSAITWRSLLTVGISGGALPCPSALVVLLSAISLHRIGFGLLLIVAFSLGLAIVLTGIGLLLVYASEFTRRIPASSALLLRMPLVSSVIISILGFAIAIQSIL